MTYRLSRGLSRRRFLSTAGAGAISTLAMPHLSRAADRPVVTSGVQSGDIGADGGVVWARADRPSQMLVEVGTSESFANVRALPPIAALPENDFTAKMLLENLPAGQEIFYRVRFRDLAHIDIESEPAIGRRGGIDAGKLGRQQPTRLHRHGDALGDDRLGFARNVASAEDVLGVAAADAGADRAGGQPGAVQCGAADRRPHAARGGDHMPVQRFGSG